MLPYIDYNDCNGGNNNNNNLDKNNEKSLKKSEPRQVGKQPQNQNQIKNGLYYFQQCNNIYSKQFKETCQAYLKCKPPYPCVNKDQGKNQFIKTEADQSIEKFQQKIIEKRDNSFLYSNNKVAIEEQENEETIQSKTLPKLGRRPIIEKSDGDIYNFGEAPTTDYLNQELQQIMDYDQQLQYQYQQQHHNNNYINDASRNIKFDDHYQQIEDDVSEKTTQLYREIQKLFMQHKFPQFHIDYFDVFLQNLSKSMICEILYKEIMLIKEQKSKYQICIKMILQRERAITELRHQLGNLKIVKQRELDEPLAVQPVLQKCCQMISSLRILTIYAVEAIYSWKVQFQRILKRAEAQGDLNLRQEYLNWQKQQEQETFEESTTTKIKERVQDKKNPIIFFYNYQNYILKAREDLFFANQSVDLTMFIPLSKKYDPFFIFPYKVVNGKTSAMSIKAKKLMICVKQCCEISEALRHRIRQCEVIMQQEYDENKNMEYQEDSHNNSFNNVRANINKVEKHNRNKRHLEHRHSQCPELDQTQQTNDQQQQRQSKVLSRQQQHKLSPQPKNGLRSTSRYHCQCVSTNYNNFNIKANDSQQQYYNRHSTKRRSLSHRRVIDAKSGKKKLHNSQIMDSERKNQSSFEMKDQELQCELQVEEEQRQKELQLEQEELERQKRIQEQEIELQQKIQKEQEELELKRKEIEKQEQLLREEQEKIRNQQLLEDELRRKKEEDQICPLDVQSLLDQIYFSNQDKDISIQQQSQMIGQQQQPGFNKQEDEQQQLLTQQASIDQNGGRQSVWVPEYDMLKRQKLNKKRNVINQSSNYQSINEDITGTVLSENEDKAQPNNISKDKLDRNQAIDQSKIINEQTQQKPNNNNIENSIQREVIRYRKSDRLTNYSQQLNRKAVLSQSAAADQYKIDCRSFLATLDLDQKEGCEPQKPKIKNTFLIQPKSLRENEIEKEIKEYVGKLPQLVKTFFINEINDLIQKMQQEINFSYLQIFELNTTGTISAMQTSQSLIGAVVSHQQDPSQIYIDHFSALDPELIPQIINELLTHLWRNTECDEVCICLFLDFESGLDLNNFQRFQFLFSKLGFNTGIVQKEKNKMLHQFIAQRPSTQQFNRVQFSSKQLTVSCNCLTLNNHTDNLFKEHSCQTLQLNSNYEDQSSIELKQDQFTFKQDVDLTLLACILQQKIDKIKNKILNQEKCKKDEQVSTSPPKKLQESTYQLQQSYSSIFVNNSYNNKSELISQVQEFLKSQKVKVQFISKNQFSNQEELVQFVKEHNDLQQMLQLINKQQEEAIENSHKQQLLQQLCIVLCRFNFACNFLNARTLTLQTSSNQIKNKLYFRLNSTNKKFTSWLLFSNVCEQPLLLIPSEVENIYLFILQINLKQQSQKVKQVNGEDLNNNSDKFIKQSQTKFNNTRCNDQLSDLFLYIRSFLMNIKSKEPCNKYIFVPQFNKTTSMRQNQYLNQFFKDKNQSQIMEQVYINFSQKNDFLGGKVIPNQPQRNNSLIFYPPFLFGLLDNALDQIMPNTPYVVSLIQQRDLITMKL